MLLDSIFGLNNFSSFVVNDLIGINLGVTMRIQNYSLVSSKIRGINTEIQKFMQMLLNSIFGKNKSKDIKTVHFSGID